MALDTAAAQAKLRSLTVKFDNAARATTPFYSRVCTMVQSDGADEEYGMLGSVPLAREWLGDRQFKTARAARFTIENKLWESSLAIPKTAIKDDRVGMYDSVVESLAVKARRAPDTDLLGSLIPGGETEVCLDGQFFYDTDHSWGESGSQSNLLDANAATPANPTVTEFNSAISQAVQAMLNFKDDSGTLLHDDAIFDMQNGMELMLVVPLSLWEVANKATTVGLKTNGGDDHVPIVMADVTASPHLSGNKFDLLRLDTPVKPFIFQAREPLSRRTKDLEDIEFKDVKFMTQQRFAVGYGAWWNAVRTNLV